MVPGESTVSTLSPSREQVEREMAKRLKARTVHSRVTSVFLNGLSFHLSLLMEGPN